MKLAQFPQLAEEGLTFFKSMTTNKFDETNQNIASFCLKISHVLTSCSCGIEIGAVRKDANIFDLGK